MPPAKRFRSAGVAGLQAERSTGWLGLYGAEQHGRRAIQAKDGKRRHARSCHAAVTARSYRLPTHTEPRIWMVTEAVLHQRNADLYSKNSWSDRGEWYRSEGIAWAWDRRAFSQTSRRYVQLAASPQASPAAIQRLGAAAEPGHWGSVHQPPAACLWERGLLPARPQQQRRESSAKQATAVAPAWVQMEHRGARIHLVPLLYTLQGFSQSGWLADMHDAHAAHTLAVCQLVPSIPRHWSACVPLRTSDRCAGWPH